MNKKLIRSLRDNPVKYAHLLGFDLLTEDVHDEWLKMMMFEKSDTTLLGHRGSYKTTCLSFAMALMIVLKPTQTIFFIRKTDDDVIEIVRQVVKILESDLFAYIVKEIYGIDFVITTATSFKIDTNLNQSTKGQVQLQGMGLNGSITGKHADFVFTDDIVNLKDRVSRAEREQTKRQYQELQNIKNRGGRIFNTGTPWHKEDCISQLMPNVHRYDCYDTGLMSDEQIQQLRDSMSPSLFAANYELKHIADEDAMFTQANYLPSDADISSIYDGVSHIDAAYGGADYTAYTILKQQQDGTFVGFGKLWEGHVDEHLDTIVAFQNFYRAGSVSCETNGDKGYLSQELQEKGLYVREYHEIMNKYIKIATYLKKYWSKIYWIDATDKDYISMILDYTEFAEHDDAPDSAASLLREIEDMPQANTEDYLTGGW